MAKERQPRNASPGGSGTDAREQELETAYAIGGKPRAPVKSADRVLSVFELFAQKKRPLRLKDFCEELCLPPSSASPLLKSLMARGYLSYDRLSRHYFPTQRIQDIAELLRNDISPEPFKEAMHRLHEETGEFIMLGLMNDLSVQYVSTIRSIHPIQFFTPSGVMRPLVRSGLGWALLADLPDERIEHIYQHSRYRRLIDQSEWPMSKLWQKISEVRQRGISVSIGTVHVGASVIAIKSPVRPNGQHYAIGVSGPSERLAANLDGIQASLRRCGLS
jgi:DNA-binding IclR family transcriptional regulator